MAEAALENEKLGQGDATDMLTVSVSSTDAIGHKYGTRGAENHDVYMQLDKDLAHFLNTLDAKVGKGNYASLPHSRPRGCPQLQLPEESPHPCRCF